MIVKNIILNSINEHKEVFNSFDDSLINNLETAGQLVRERLNSSNKIFFAGNGGSAGDSQHLATEFIVKFKKVRKPLPAIALTTDTSLITACSNDFSFDDIFSRQLSALGSKGDILFAISTSGESKNIIKACNVASEKGIDVISFSGNSKSTLDDLSTISIKAPSNTVSRIQECHIFFGQVICEYIDELF